MLTTLLMMFLSVIATSVYFIVSRRRRTPELNLDPDALPHISECLSILAGATNSVVHQGNRVEIFQNSNIFPAMIEAIKNARDTIHLETFVWSKGKLEKQFVELLCMKVREGVRTRVLIDAVGAMDADPEQLKKLCECGVDMRMYCQPRWWNWRRFNHRTHRKLLIVDGKAGFIFGHGIADQWLGDGQDKAHWRDTGVKVLGPVVHSIQSVFLENWIEETTEVPTDESCFPVLEKQGSASAHVVSSATGEALSSVALLYTLAIACARKEIIIQNPYFAPEKNLARLMVDMVKRGVDVHLMVPGKHTDSPFVRRAGCSLYRPLLEGGVRLYEYNPTLLHQKIVIIDRAWVHVGSTNFDARSLALNEEVGIGILDEQAATELSAAFMEDLKRSEEISLDAWMKRKIHTRLIDWFAYMLRSQM